MKKNIYLSLTIVSFVLMSGNSDSFVGWLLWEAFWLSVFLFSAYQLYRLEESR